MDDLTKRVKRNFKNKLQDQLENYKTRLSNKGVDPEEVTDDRNLLEKALNLKKDQNILFDIFEILDRPRNALFTGIKNANEGKDFVKGLEQGITGKKETSGKDLLMDTFDMIDEKGKLNAVDVLSVLFEYFFKTVSLLS